MKYLIPGILVAILFALLYSIYKTKTRRYIHFKQISSALIGALILAYVLYTCQSDN